MTSSVDPRIFFNIGHTTWKRVNATDGTLFHIPKKNIMAGALVRFYSYRGKIQPPFITKNVTKMYFTSSTSYRELRQKIFWEWLFSFLFVCFSYFVGLFSDTKRRISISLENICYLLFQNREQVIWQKTSVWFYLFGTVAAQHPLDTFNKTIR